MNKVSVSSFWTWNGTAISTAPGAQGGFFPFINSEGYIWISWLDQRKDEGDIYVQKIAPDGKALLTANGKSVYADDNKSNSPRMVLDGRGGGIITWHDNRTGLNEVYLQRIDQQGELKWDVGGIRVTNLSSLQENPQIVNISDGNFVVIWEDNRTGTKDIYAQKIDLQGNLLWGENGTSVCNATGDQTLYYNRKNLISTDQNEVVVVWRDQRTDLGDIFSQLIDLSGTSQWESNGIVVCNASDYQGTPIINIANNNTFIYLWLDDRKGSGLTDVDMYIQKVNRSGMTQWQPNGTLVVNSSNNQFQNQLYVYNESNIFATWRDNRLDISGDIYMQKFNASGSSKWGGNGTVVANVSGEERNPMLVVSGNNLFIAWVDKGISPFSMLIMKYDLNGTKLWGTPITGMNGTFNFILYNIIADGEGGIILTWLDNRNDPNGDLYILRLTGDGELWAPPGDGKPPDDWWLIILIITLSITVPASVGAGLATLFIVRRRRPEVRIPPKKVVPSKKLTEEEEKTLTCLVRFFSIIYRKES
ncbi:MAG: hypothetical protein ACTSYF_06035 [Promethearchaeota archaeon]